MNARVPIPPDDLCLKAIDLWTNRWLLLTSGDFRAGHFNSMTVAWGSIGQMWDRPFAQVVVRPSRYTYGFMERYPTFTLCAFPEAYRGALELLGSKSGRDGDKIAEAGLTPQAASVVAAPCFAEADLVIECRKMYWDDLAPERFGDAAIASLYPRGDYHRVYFGEILAVSGSPDYRACKAK
ncbi:MAG: flavin reductase [bacterium]|jgi:flavin reductase (DIM6/NTAB) family NADH-FMN oxidoreductase RutF|nr:flavin reductase [candidate division KSB1 bacterium]MDH7559796.1 flavin reductase [bacterium]